jgi:hypothetical protein
MPPHNTIPSAHPYICLSYSPSFLQPDIVNPKDSDEPYMLFFSRRQPDCVDGGGGNAAGQPSEKKSSIFGMKSMKSKQNGKGAKAVQQDQSVDQRRHHRLGRNFKIRRQTFSVPSAWPQPFAALPESVQGEILKRGGKEDMLPAAMEQEGEGEAGTPSGKQAEGKQAEEKQAELLSRIDDALGDDDDDDMNRRRSSCPDVPGPTQGDGVDRDWDKWWAQPLKEGWQQVENPGSTWGGDMFYFHNIETGETTWEGHRAKENAPKPAFL